MPFAQGALPTGRAEEYSSIEVTSAMRLHRIVPAASRAAGFAVLLAALALATGCSSNHLPTPPPQTPLSSLVIAPTFDTLAVGGTRAFTVTAHDTAGALVSGPSVDWSSSNTGVITVSRSGVATAVGEGSAWVRAASGGKADSAIVSVFTQAGWYTQTSNTSHNLNDVTFASDGRTGVAVGALGTIVRTSDAGVTWATVTSGTSFNLNGVAYSSGANVWAVGANGTLLHSTSGGASWFTMTGLGTVSDLHDILFRQTLFGCAVGAGGTVLITRNGGVSWTRSNPTVAQLNAVAFSDSVDGWAFAETGLILGTHDGGRSWYIVQPAVTANALRGGWRLSNVAATAVGVQGTAPFTSETVDSLQWSNGNLGAANDLSAIQFVDNLTGYIVGSNGSGVILKTVNGGALWSPQVSNSAQPLNGVWFVDGQRGWAVGNAGRIVHTSRGGNL